jgi:hypothetical protein
MSKKNNSFKHNKFDFNVDIREMRAIHIIIAIIVILLVMLFIVWYWHFVSHNTTEQILIKVTGHSFYYIGIVVLFAGLQIMLLLFKSYTKPWSTCGRIIFYSFSHLYSLATFIYLIILYRNHDLSWTDGVFTTNYKNTGLLIALPIIFLFMAIDILESNKNSKIK